MRWTVWMALAAAGIAVSQNRRLAVERLNPDLAPYIPDPAAVIAAAKVISCDAKPVAQEPVEQLTVRLEILDVIQGPGLHTGAVVEIVGRRLADPEARFRSRFDRWNALDFNPGDLLVVALARPPDSNGWTALAAATVTSLKDPVVGALRRASAIEHSAHEPRLAALEEALSSPSDLLQRYAINAVARRGLASREQGAEMMARALFSRRILPDARQPLALELASRDFYQYEHGADRTNITVIRAFARLLVEGGPQQELWVQLLGASLAIKLSQDPAKDAEMRLALIRAVGDPPPDRVIAALEKLTGTDPRVPKLLSAWKSAR